MENNDNVCTTKNRTVFAHNNGCLPHTPTTPCFLEVLCRGEEKFRRFAVGTKAGFALDRINRKLAENAREATCIEAVKDGEEPVEFGPNAELVIYGPGWSLQTLHEQDLVFRSLNSSLYHNQTKQNLSEFYPTSKVRRRSDPKFSVQYFAKIALAFCFVFFLAGTFMLILENLPHFLLYLQA